MAGEQTFVRLAQGVFVIVGGVLLTMPVSMFPDYYKPRLMGLICFFYCFLIYLPVKLFHIPDSAPNRKRTVFLRGHLQAALSVGLMASGLGSLGLWGLYKRGIPYDKFVHFVFPALLMIAFVYFLQSWRGWSFKKTALIVGLAVASSGVLWELIEFGFDRWFHLGFFGGLFDEDSLRDIYTNVLGVGTGGAIIAWRQWLERKLS